MKWNTRANKLATQHTELKFYSPFDECCLFLSAAQYTSPCIQRRRYRLNFEGFPTLFPPTSTLTKLDPLSLGRRLRSGTTMLCAHSGFRRIFYGRGGFATWSSRKRHSYFKENTEKEKRKGYSTRGSKIICAEMRGFHFDEN